MNEIKNRRPLASRQTGWATVITKRLAATSVTPNQISMASMAAVRTDMVSGRQQGAGQLHRPQRLAKLAQPQHRAPHARMRAAFTKVAQDQIEPVAAHVTSRQVLAQEEAVLTWVLDSQLDDPQPSSTVTRGGLDVLQFDAAAAVAGEDRVVVIVGPAGTGKTTTLAAAVTDLHRHSRRERAPAIAEHDRVAARRRRDVVVLLARKTVVDGEEVGVTIPVEVADGDGACDREFVGEGARGGPGHRAVAQRRWIDVVGRPRGVARPRTGGRRADAAPVFHGNLIS